MPESLWHSKNIKFPLFSPPSCPIPLSAIELISLANCKLVFVLCCRLTAHPLAPDQFQSLGYSLLTSLPKQVDVTPRISAKERYKPENCLGLNLSDLESAIHKFTVSNALRFSKNAGPAFPCAVMKSAYLDDEPNWILDTF